MKPSSDFMIWEDVRTMLAEIAGNLGDTTPSKPPASKGQPYLDWLLALEASTKPEVERAIQLLAHGSILPQLSADERFILQLRVIHAMTFPIVFDIPCSVGQRHFVPDVCDSGVGIPAVLVWLLSDIWAQLGHSYLLEFAKQASCPYAIELPGEQHASDRSGA